MKCCLYCKNTFQSQNWLCPVCGKEPASEGKFHSFCKNMNEKIGGFESDAFDRLAALETNNFWFESRNQMILWALEKYFQKSKSFLEAGCGTGFVLQAIEREHPDWDLYGGEMFVEGLNQASKRLKKTGLLHMDIRSIPFKDQFDVVGAFDVLEHVPEDEQAIAQTYNAAVRGGGVLITVPQHAFLWSHEDVVSHHMRRYNRQDLCRKIEAAGFKILTVTSFVSFLLPLMWVSRLFQQKASADFDPAAELKINPLTNFVFKKVLDFERFLIRWGVRFPMGGSLLVAAKKE
ncbi:MAG TPA: methyltransferase domain-containing protein [bacterium]|jgi:SAM-dependent methyltransferase|nr:methyltransferase domain-containing protein [bacterium]